MRDGLPRISLRSSGLRVGRGDEGGDAAEHGGVGDGGAAVAVARGGEGGGEIIAEERDVGAVRAIAHAERAAGSVAIVARRLHLGRIDVGEVVDSGGSLSFDKYDANQIVQFAGVDDKEDRFAGVAVSDSVPSGENHRRIWVGRGDDGTAVVALMDGKGRKRISMEVTADGTPRLSFLDADGKVVNKMTPAKQQ